LTAARTDVVIDGIPYNDPRAEQRHKGEATVKRVSTRRAGAASYPTPPERIVT